MINIKHKYCIYEGCNVRPNYNLPSEKKAIYCNIHKLPNMIDIGHKCCIHKNCNIRPNYNLPSEKKAIYCNKHKLSDMINIKHKYCIYEGCNVRPNYNLPSEKKAIYCNKHKLEHMINIQDKKCIFNGCNIQPNYNYLGLSAEFCATHKKQNMLLVKRLTCRFKDCKEKSVFGKNCVLLHCEQHKEHDEIDLVNLLCTKCNLPGVTSSKMLCYHCDIWFNNKPERLVKQNTIKRLLDAHNIFYYKSDLQLDEKSCGRERPDFIIINKNLKNEPRALILEVDENQHKERDCVCEQTRMINIAESLGMPTLFIRYNPDKYKPDQDFKQIKQQTRQKILIELLKYDKILDFKCTIKVIYLFFDGHNNNKLDTHKLR
jgi:hypothetical protein